MPATVQVEGLREYIRALEAAGVDIEDLKDVFGEIASESAAVAAPVVPRRTGTLAGTVRGNRAKNKAVVTIGKARTPYAAPIIWGWPARGIKASPVVPRTNQYMETRAPELLETGLERLTEGLGL